MGAQDPLNHVRRLHRRTRPVQVKDNRDAPTIVPSTTKEKLILTPLDSYRRDVFASYPSGGGDMSKESIDEYIGIYRKEELCLKITPDVDHPAVSVVFPMSMQDPDLFKCLLMGAQSLYDWRRDPFHVNRSHDMLKLQNEAILAVRKRLSAPEAHLDDGILVAITHLMVADSCRRDLLSLKAHLRGVRQIISLRGGLGNSPAHLAVTAIVNMIEFYIALGQYLEISPDDPASISTRQIEFIHHPFPPDICRDIAKLPVGLAEAALTGHLSVQCIKLLAEAASWAPLVNGATTSPEQATNARDRYCRLFAEPRECSRNAVMLLLDLRRSGLPPGLEHVICLGLAIAVRHVSGENRTNIFDTASLAALAKVIKTIDNPSVADSEVIIWMSLLVTWRTQSAKPIPRANELLDYVLESFPASRTWKRVSMICRKFWWFERFQSDWERCWRRAITRQQQRSVSESSLRGVRCREAFLASSLPSSASVRTHSNIGEVE
ncbi:hypothetical protein A1O7_01215 [Cladophialophora yegresii CBS 114405]|uniref:Transcription factor domain-containing protein n=1 Tax=Cladophialophora yegresii CBS 114405 TaxID=1182544 RepID=W9WJV7_9EURO|nr:uncharacterized protein A1O7_01215 [Cladophialophora yegresii CBS 114405]EXJ64876.1 hypothetical protein A1O7_01215 [Cladophialophora yegresii CBS 114405]